MHQAGVTGRDGQAVPAAAPFQIGGRLLTAVVLRLTGDADDAFYAALDARLKQAPQFFAHVPLVLDLDKAAGCEVNFRLLVLEMRTRKLSLVGIQGGTAEQKRAALAAGLISLRGGREPQADGARRNGATAKLPPRAAAMMVTEPVRSGQRIFAEAGDLVVVGAVGSGAEVVASGNIHIYGALRGRALAGATGDAKARIFCHSLDAELVAIAGTYRTNDDIDAAARKQRAQVFLRDDALCIEPLK